MTSKILDIHKGIYEKLDYFITNNKIPQLYFMVNRVVVKTNMNNFIVDL